MLGLVHALLGVQDVLGDAEVYHEVVGPGPILGHRNAECHNSEIFG